MPRLIHQSHRCRHRTGCVVWTDAPVFCCVSEESVESDGARGTLRSDVLS